MTYAKFYKRHAQIVDYIRTTRSVNEQELVKLFPESRKLRHTLRKRLTITGKKPNRLYCMKYPKIDELALIRANSLYYNTKRSDLRTLLCDVCTFRTNSKTILNRHCLRKHYAN